MAVEVQALVDFRVGGAAAVLPAGLAVERSTLSVPASVLDRGLSAAAVPVLLRL